MTAEEPKLTLVEPGRIVSFRGRLGAHRTEKVGRVWEVTVAGAVIGCVGYVMLTHETRPAGRTYVSTRWESPGWVFGPASKWPTHRAASRMAAVEQLVRIWEAKR